MFSHIPAPPLAGPDMGAAALADAAAVSMDGKDPLIVEGYSPGDLVTLAGIDTGVAGRVMYGRGPESVRRYVVGFPDGSRRVLPARLLRPAS